MSDVGKPPIHVLVVDDDPAFTKSVERDLRAAGYDAVTATTLFGALDIIENSGQPIDVLLADLQLDQGNGIALARMARLRRRSLRTVYVTGYDIASDDPGFPVLRKPLDRETICRAIELAVSEQQ